MVEAPLLKVQSWKLEGWPFHIESLQLHSQNEMDMKFLHSLSSSNACLSIRLFLDIPIDNTSFEYQFCFLERGRMVHMSHAQLPPLNSMPVYSNLHQIPPFSFT